MLRYAEELKQLRLPQGQYAVFGSGLLAMLNIRENEDIDLIVKERLWKKLLRHHDPLPDNSSAIRIGHIEFCKDWLPWFENSDKLIDEAEVIDDIPFVKMEYVETEKQVADILTKPVPQDKYKQLRTLMGVT